VSRGSDRSISADWRQMHMQLPALLAEINFQVEHRVEPEDQVLIRIGFHHPLAAQTFRFLQLHPRIQHWRVAVPPRVRQDQRAGTGFRPNSLE